LAAHGTDTADALTAEVVAYINVIGFV